MIILESTTAWTSAALNWSLDCLRQQEQLVHKFRDVNTLLLAIAENFGKIFNLAIWWILWRSIAEFKIAKHMHAYDAEHSDRQIKILPIPNDIHFAKFNACQSYPL